MIVKIEGPIETFAKWKAMVHNNSEKIKKYGMTFLYAGSEKGNEAKITAIIRFDTMEGLEGFKLMMSFIKKELLLGVDLANSVTTPMGR